MSYIPASQCNCKDNMNHDYKYENLPEEDRNALIPWNRRRTFFADYEKPVFDGPQHSLCPRCGADRWIKKLGGWVCETCRWFVARSFGPLPNLNTENAGE